MNVSDAGVTLIKQFEGFPYGGRPYKDMVGVWTIGFGHTEGVGPKSSVLTIAQASDLLARDLDRKYAPPVDGVGVTLEQHQFDALVSFVYNCGPGAVSTQTHVGRAVRAKQWQAAGDALLEWNKAGGKPVAGLTRRRQAERAMFLADVKADPLDGYSDAEVRWIREYDGLVREGKDPDRRAVLRRVMSEQRQKIWHLAQPTAKGGDGHGWDEMHRRARYNSLLARTH